MKKITLLLMIAFGWLHKAASQSNAGLEQYYYMNNKTLTVTPTAWYQSETGWYVEGNYNYEAAKTVAVLAGKAFEHKGALSYNIAPLVGIVKGELNGGAIVENATASYKHFKFSQQSQYIFSIENQSQNSLSSWSDLGYDLRHWLSAGISVQQTRLYHTKGKSETGFFLKPASGKWEFPLYLFNVQGDERYLILGLNYTLK